ncbi:SAM-dependent methyltransferase [Streptomyces nodosus]|uniref:SAM-dependent methyltransferase n=1 Tax=Streptomyces nodosus TaxID=40318 RepID=UPI003F512724
MPLLHFVSDEYGPYYLVNELLAPLPFGSFLMLSHVTGDFDAASWLCGLWRRMARAGRGRPASKHSPRCPGP